MWARLLLITPAIALALGCIDAPGALPDPGARCTTDHHRITSVTLPRTAAEASRMGFDLDGAQGGDPAIDNQLGALSAALSVIYDDWRPADALTARLAQRDVLWLLAIERCVGAAGVRVALARGNDNDGDGRLRLDAPGVPAEGPGATAGGGVGLVPVGHVTDGGGTAAVDLWEEAPSLTVAVRTGSTGVVATIGLGLELADQALAPAAAFLTDELTAGSRFAAGIDADRDRVVTVAELQASPAVRALLAADVDLTGAGRASHRSIGFEVGAVPVTVEPSGN